MLDVSEKRHSWITFQQKDSFDWRLSADTLMLTLARSSTRCTSGDLLALNFVPFPLNKNKHVEEERSLTQWSWKKKQGEKNNLLN